MSGRSAVAEPEPQPASSVEEAALSAMLGLETARYLCLYKDVLQAYLADGRVAEEHYRRHGRAEGRRAPAEIVPAGFVRLARFGAELLCGEVVQFATATEEDRLSANLLLWLERAAGCTTRLNFTLDARPIEAVLAEARVRCGGREFLFVDAQLALPRDSDPAAVALAVADANGVVLGTWAPGTPPELQPAEARYLCLYDDVRDAFVARSLSVEEHYEHHGRAESRTAPQHIVPVGLVLPTPGAETLVRGEVVRCLSTSKDGVARVALHLWLDCLDGERRRLAFSVGGRRVATELSEAVLPIGRRRYVFAYAQIAVPDPGHPVAVSLAVTGDSTGTLATWAARQPSELTPEEARYLCLYEDVLSDYDPHGVSVLEHYELYGCNALRTAPDAIVPIGSFRAARRGAPAVRGEIVELRRESEADATRLHLRLWVQCPAGETPRPSLTLYGEAIAAEISERAVPTAGPEVVFAYAQVAIAPQDDPVGIGVAILGEDGAVIAEWRPEERLIGSAWVETEPAGDCVQIGGWLLREPPETLSLRLEIDGHQIPVTAIAAEHAARGPSTLAAQRACHRWVALVRLPLLAPGTYAARIGALHRADGSAREWGPFPVGIAAARSAAPAQLRFTPSEPGRPRVGVLGLDGAALAAWQEALGAACFGAFDDLETLFEGGEDAAAAGALVVAIPLSPTPPPAGELLDWIGRFAETADLSLPARLCRDGRAGPQMLLATYDVLRDMARAEVRRADRSAAPGGSALLDYLSEAPLRVQLSHAPPAVIVERALLGHHPVSYLAVSGQATTAGGAPLELELVASDGVVIPAAYSLARQRRSEAPPHAPLLPGALGFEFAVRWRDLPVGVHRLRLRARSSGEEVEAAVPASGSVPPIMHVIEDAVAATLTGKRIVSVRGWAAAHDRSPVQIALGVGDRMLPLQTSWTSRTDVDAHFGESEPGRFGFVGRAAVPGTGAETLRLGLWCGCGHIVTPPIPLRELDGALRCHVAAPRWLEDGPRLVVSGWAASGRSDLDWVALMRGGKVVARGAATATVEHAEAPPDSQPLCEFCGFELSADLSAEAGRNLVLDLVASIDGELHRLKRIAVAVPDTGRTVRASWDQPLDGTALDEDTPIRLVGWAIAESRERLRIEASVGGEAIDATETGFGRPDVAQAFGIADHDFRPGFVLELGRRLRAGERIAVTLRCLDPRRGTAISLGTRRFVGRAVRAASDRRWTRWLAANALSERSRADAEAVIAQWPRQPLISIVMPHFNSGPQWFERAVGSIARQWYRNFELCVADDASTMLECRRSLEEAGARYAWVRTAYRPTNGGIAAASNSAAALARGEYLLLLDQDDELAPNCLFELVKRWQARPDLDIIYSDADKIDTAGRRFDPHLKPDYSPDLLYSYMYLNQAMLVRRSLFESVGGFRLGFDGSQDHDLALRLVERTDRIAHVPAILYHWRAHAGSTALSGEEKPRSFEAGIRAVGDALQRRGLPFENVVRPDFAVNSGIGCYRVRWTVRGTPLVSIVIPSHNRSDLLATCTESIERLTTYPAYEIVFVDDRSDDPATLDYLAAAPHRVVRIEDRGQGFNFSALVNAGGRESRGDYLVILNNDTEVVTPEWLEELLGWAQQPGIGVVGCRLLYPGGGMVQHAGVALDLVDGCPGHLFRGEPSYGGGYYGWSLLARNCSAVTFAAAMIPRRVFDQLGGLDEKEFPVAYQDPDFCLRAAQRGYRTVYTPFAELIHREGLSKRLDFDDAGDALAFRIRWPQRDPFLNPNFCGLGEAPALADRRTLLTDPNARVRIAAFAQSLEREGAPVSQLLMLRGLVERHGFLVDLLTCSDGPLLPDYERFAATVTRLPSDDAKSWRSQAQRWLDAARPHLAYANTLDAVWYIDAALERGHATFWNIRESVDPNFYFRDHADRRRVAEHCAARAGRLGFVAQATWKLFRAKLPALAPAVVIANGVDLDRFHPAADLASARRWVDLGLPQDAVIVGTVGTVCPRKAQHLAIRAFIALQRQRPDLPLWFLSVGKIPAQLLGYEMIVRRVVASSPLPERILLLPEVEDIAGWYRTFDIFVTATLQESFPRVVIEAMACGLPVVASDVFGVAEQVIDGRTGRLLPPGAVEDVAAALRQLAEQAELRRDMGERGRRVAEAAFSTDKMIDAYAAEFRLLREEHG